MITDNDIETGIVNKQIINNWIIPLHDPSKSEYIAYGFITAHFAEQMLSEPYSSGETNNYKWNIRRVDGLINLRVWKIE